MVRSNEEEGEEEGEGGLSHSRSRPLWPASRERVWGEHMHHGIYPGGFDREDHVRAQVEMIDRVVDSAGVERAESVLDAGCGVGGALRHIATRFDAAGAGITLSQYQARRATELSEEGGFEALDFLVADACDQPFGDSTFDFVLSLEVGEHIPDRAAFLRELARVAAPGAKIAVVAWTRRELGSSETSLPPDEQAILDALSGAFNLPRWSPASEYVRLMERECGLEGVRSQDWTKEVEPFWRAVVASALTPDGIGGLLRAGPPSWLGAAAMPLMQVGFARGTVRFSVLSATKPSSRFPETG